MAALDRAPEAGEIPELFFPDGLPGFPLEQRFALVRWGGDDSPFSLMQSVTDAELRFVVVPAEIFFPGYAPVIDDTAAARLGLGTADDAIVLLVVSLGTRPEEATANLLGPVVINRHTRTAAQVVLSGQDLPTRRHLVGV